MKPPAPHSFREKTFRRGGACAACREPLGPQGLVCRVCKVTSHKKCETKVTSPCHALPPPELRRNTAPPARRSEHLGSTKSLNSPRQRNTLPRSCSLEQVLERRFECDLTYVTERILSLRFPAALDEPRYRGHLRDVAALLGSRHRDRYMLFNLSEKRRDISRLNPKVQDFGWPDLHAPPLDKLCSICKALEAWLRAHPQHVAVLHCKGSKGKTGVIVAAYMHYSKVSASADQALGTLMMRKFCEEKVAAALQPSQRRYIAYFGGLLSGSIRMNSSPLFLHHVLLPALRGFEPGHGFQPFLKIYQSLQLVYTSGVYSISGPGPQSLCINLEPALLLKGDVMVKCYHRRARGAGRHAVFRAQFHTCTLQGARLRLRKDELDDACTDERFPFDATVEFIFSSGPEKIKGWESLRSPPAVTVDLSVGDPAVRWDSYEGFNLRHQDSLEDVSHTRGPLDGSPYARVQRPRAPGAWSSGWDSDPPTPPGGDPGTPPSRPPPPTAAERQELERLLGGFGVREAPPGDRETPILEDEHPDSAPCSAPVSHGNAVPCGTPASYGTPASQGSPASHGTPTFQGSPASHGSPTSRGTPVSHGTTASYGSPASHGTPTFQGSPASHGSPISHGTPTSFGTTAPYGSPTSHASLTPYGTPIPQGTPISHESPTPYGSPTFLGSPMSHGSPTFYGTPAPYGSPTSCGSPTSHGTPMSHGTPTSYGSLMSHGTPTFQGTPTSHRSAALYGPPAPHSPPAPPLCRRASLAPPCSCHPRYGAEGGLGGPGGGEKRGVQRSLSEGLPPCGYGRRGGGCLLLEELPPPCPCPDCQGPPPIYGVHLERGGERWGGSPRPPAPGEALEPPPCPRCGRAGSGGGRGPPRDPYGNVGYDPPALEAREGYGIPGQPDPPERRSPGEGGPWRGTPEVPPPLHQPPRDPDAPSTLRGGPAEPPPPSSAHGRAGEVPGSPTPAFPPPAAYCAPPSPQPPLPEKRHPPAPGGPRDRASPPQTHSSPGGGAHACQSPPEPDAPTGVTFVQDTSKFWYKPGLSRDQAVSLLKGRPPGAFLVRLSSSFPGAYGLALKVAAPPPRCRPPHNGDPQEQLVRHFLIETGPRGVKIKGCPDEPHFGSLPALVLQHSITPISLPCALRIPSKDLLEETLEGPGPPNMSTAADLLRQGAACSVRFLGSVETESLTGPQAVAKAVGSVLGGPPRPPPCTVHFKVSAQGITLTDSQRKLFFRRHYPVSNVTYCSTDPQDRRWTNPDGTSSKIFGFVAKVAGGPGGGNACHLFTELDPEQPASAIVTFVTKVLLGTHRK